MSLLVKSYNIFELAHFTYFGVFYFPTLSKHVPDKLTFLLPLEFQWSLFIYQQFMCWITKSTHPNWMVNHKSAFYQLPYSYAYISISKIILILVLICYNSKSNLWCISWNFINLKIQSNFTIERELTKQHISTLHVNCHIHTLVVPILYVPHSDKYLV